MSVLGLLYFSVHNTLYLEVHCPAVRPELLVISDSGNTVSDFGSVSLGHSVTKSVTIQNITDSVIYVSLKVELRHICVLLVEFGRREG